MTNREREELLEALEAKQLELKHVRITGVLLFTTLVLLLVFS